MGFDAVQMRFSSFVLVLKKLSDHWKKYFNYNSVVQRCVGFYTAYMICIKQKQ